MWIKRALLVALAFLAAVSLPLFWKNAEPSSGFAAGKLTTGLGAVENLQASYESWEAEYVRAGGDRNEVMELGWFKGLSNVWTTAHGTVRLNSIDGIVSAEVEGLSEKEQWDLWLIDDRAAPGHTIIPEPGDVMLRVGTLKHENTAARLDAHLGPQAFKDFEVDLVVITRKDRNPADERVVVGSTTLFHRLYRGAQRGQFAALEEDGAPQAVAAGVIARAVEMLSPTAAAQIGPAPDLADALEALIARGRKSFFNETFNGNGRTCGTCHREDENLAIGPDFIATLPPNDPLFVAEFNPNLARHFENPVLMRKYGLILENVDGFEDLTTKFVMRGVPHTLAMLPNTLKPLAVDGSTIPPKERTGWSGDGAPGTGTLREFIIGAVTQHYPKTLARVAGSDFRLPTSLEMDALEAFMKSTGRRADLVLSGPNALSLKSEVARRGQEIFMNPGPNGTAGKCLNCHMNAGAGFGAAATDNGNFDTGVEDQPSQPADLTVPPEQNPPDGGFGTQPLFRNGQFVGFGNRTFNTPVLVEAADTPPFFHNNSVATIEGAIAFYNSASFNNSPSGIFQGGIRLEATEIEALGAFLRVINSLENLRSSFDLETRAKRALLLEPAQELLQLSIAELDDAIEVLQGAGLHPTARQKLTVAIRLDRQAMVTADRVLRNQIIDQAIAAKRAARVEMASN